MQAVLMSLLLVLFLECGAVTTIGKLCCCVVSPLARAGLGFPTVTRSLKCRKCTIPDLTAIQPNFKAEEGQKH